MRIASKTDFRKSPEHERRPLRASPVLSELHKFIFEGMPVRGMLVRLTDA